MPGFFGDPYLFYYQHAADPFLCGAVHFRILVYFFYGQEHSGAGDDLYGGKSGTARAVYEF